MTPPPLPRPLGPPHAYFVLILVWMTSMSASRRACTHARMHVGTRSSAYIVGFGMLLSIRSLSRWKKDVQTGRRKAEDLGREHGRDNALLFEAYLRGGRKEAQRFFPNWPRDRSEGFYPQVPLRTRFDFVFNNTLVVRKRPAADVCLETTEELPHRDA